MEKGAAPTKSPDTLGTFLSGMWNGAMNGGIMAAIYFPIAILAGFTIVHPFVAAAVMVAATSLFGGVASLRKEHNERKAELESGHSPMRSAEIAQAPAIAMPIFADKAESPSVGEEKMNQWRDRAQSSRGDSIQAILSRGSRSEGTHASALQEERISAQTQGAALA